MHCLLLCVRQYCVVQIHYWRHWGRHANWPQYFDRFGMQLNDADMRKFARRIRGAAMFAAAHFEALWLSQVSSVVVGRCLAFIVYVALTHLLGLPVFNKSYPSCNKPYPMKPTTCCTFYILSAWLFRLIHVASPSILMGLYHLSCLYGVPLVYARGHTYIEEFLLCLYGVPLTFCRSYSHWRCHQFPAHGEHQWWWCTHPYWWTPLHWVPPCPTALGATLSHRTKGKIWADEYVNI